MRSRWMVGQSSHYTLVDVQLLHVENNCDGAVECSEVMGPCCLSSEK